MGTEDAPNYDHPWDWYVAAVSGGHAVKTGAFEAVGKQKLLDNFVVPLVWIPEGNRILFAGELGGHYQSLATADLRQELADPGYPAACYLGCGARNDCSGGR